MAKMVKIILTLTPSRQYLATVCRSMPCLLAISLKFGFAPDPL